MSQTDPTASAASDIDERPSGWPPPIKPSVSDAARAAAQAQVPHVGQLPAVGQLQAYVGPSRTHGLAQDSEGRKRQPMYAGLVAYFCDALAEVAGVSYQGNQKHNPGKPLQWARDKSGDEPDCEVRHLCERGGWIEGEYPQPVRHAAARAWRALADLQKEIERDRGDGIISPGSSLFGMPAHEHNALPLAERLERLAKVKQPG